MENNRNVAVIPARKGSKRFPGKNRALINGKSLVEHAISCAHAAGIFDQIILSTDDEHFFDLNERYPYLYVRQRPKGISQDNSTPYDVLIDLCESCNLGQPVRFCYLQPTSPLRLPSDLINSISDNSISVYYDQKNTLNNCHKVIDVVKASQLTNHLKGSADNIDCFYFNGLFYWIDKVNLIQQGGLVGASTIFIETPVERSYDIDFEEEFEQAKLKLEGSGALEDER